MTSMKKLWKGCKRFHSNYCTPPRGEVPVITRSPYQEESKDSCDYPKSLSEKLNDPQLLDWCHGSKAMFWGCLVWLVFGVIVVLVT